MAAEAAFLEGEAGGPVSWAQRGRRVDGGPKVVAGARQRRGRKGGGGGSHARHCAVVCGRRGRATAVPYPLSDGQSGGGEHGRVQHAGGCVPYRPRSPAHSHRRRLRRVAAWQSRVVAASAPACQRLPPTHPPAPRPAPPRDARLSRAAQRVTSAAAAASVSTAIVPPRVPLPRRCRCRCRPLCHLPCLPVPCISTYRGLTAPRTLSLNQPPAPSPPPPSPSERQQRGVLSGR